MLEIAAGVVVTDPDGFGEDVIGTEDLRKPAFIDVFAFAELGPRAVGEGVEVSGQSAAEDAVSVVGDHGQENIEEESADGIMFLGGSGEAEGGVAGEGGPLAAGEVGEGEEGFPGIGGAVVEVGGDEGFGGGNGVSVIGDEAKALAAEIGGVELRKALGSLAGGFAFHADEDTAVGEGVREAADGGEGFRAPGGEGRERAGRWVRASRLVFRRVGAGLRAMGDADDESGFPLAAGIEDAAQGVVAFEEGIGFIDEEGRRDLLNEAVPGWGADIGGDDGAIDEFTEDGEEGGFAAAFFGRLDADVGTGVTEVKGIGVDNPKGQGFGGPFGEDDEGAEQGKDLVEQVAAGDGLSPRDDFFGVDAVFEGSIFGGIHS